MFGNKFFSAGDKNTNRKTPNIASESSLKPYPVQNDEIACEFRSFCRY